MQVTMRIILDTRRMKKGGTYPLKLQVTYQRKARHFPTLFNLSEEDYRKLNSPRIGAALQQVRDDVKRIEREAEEFLEGVEAFSFYLFQRNFVNQHDLLRRRKMGEEDEVKETEVEVDFRLYHKRFPLLKERHLPSQSIGAVYQSVIRNLLKEERIGTALAYKDSYNSIKKFKGNLLFAEVTVSVLHQYEQWMVKKGQEPHHGGHQTAQPAGGVQRSYFSRSY